jgi:hypothetical protein
VRTWCAKHPRACVEVYPRLIEVLERCQREHEAARCDAIAERLLDLPRVDDGPAGSATEPGERLRRLRQACQTGDAGACRELQALCGQRPDLCPVPAVVTLVPSTATPPPARPVATQAPPGVRPDPTPAPARTSQDVAPTMRPPATATPSPDAGRPPPGR